MGGTSPFLQEEEASRNGLVRGAAATRGWESLGRGSWYGHSFAATLTGTSRRTRCKGGSAMMKKGLAHTIFLVVAFSLPAAADEASLKFKHGIGVIPVTSVTCVPSATPCVSPTETVTVTQNVVRGQQPGGEVWVIDELDAEVSANGNIMVRGTGLLLGGGNGAGGVPAGTNVFATLSCQSTSPFALSSTSPAGVPVSPNGNFQINGMLSPAPTFPCASPLLLIQSASNSHWFAFGIVSSDN